MNKLFLLCFLMISSTLISQNTKVLSPNGKLRLNVFVENGKPVYSVTYNDEVMLHNSPLGLKTNEGTFDKDMSFVESSNGKVNKQFKQDKIKQSTIKYEANSLRFTIANAEKKQLSIVFQVSNNDVAIRYELPEWGETISCVVTEEATGYKFPSYITSFLSPMMKPMTDFARTAPSYKSSYTADALHII